jgi:Protein of unknown function (DUF4236)
MPLRFRKILKLSDFIKINISKTGFSLSFGRPGLILNVGRKIKTMTISILGTGISYRFFFKKINLRHILFLIVVMSLIFLLKSK